jgi:hypothetical protein
MLAGISTSLTHAVDDKDDDKLSGSARNPVVPGPVPAPKELPGFPDAWRDKPKTPRPGGGLRPRWKDADGNIYEWDSQHGAVERYNKRGEHLGEYDPNTGARRKGPDRTRRVEP